MAVGTREVLGGIVLLLLLGGVVSTRMDRDQVGIWLTTAAFAVGTVWAGMSIYWARDNPSMVPADSYIALFALAMSATAFYGYKAINGVGLTERL